MDLQPRPDNFGDLDQHLTAVEADVIFAAFGFNESFAGIEAIPEFKKRLRGFIKHTVSRAYNGSTGPQLVLVSPVANENVEGVAAADLNNGRLDAYTRAMEEVAREEKVGFIDVFSATRYAMDDPSTDLTFNGAHMQRGRLSRFCQSGLREDLWGRNGTGSERADTESGYR